MAFGRRHFTHNYNTPVFKRAMQDNCTVFKLLLKNNSYLLKQRGITLYRQLKDIQSAGFVIGYSNIHKLRSGKSISASLTYLHVFTAYWGLDLVDMLACDFESRDEALRSQENV